MVADNEVDVAALAAALSRMDETAALNYFWLMMRQKADPLTILGWMGHVVLERPQSWDKRRIRLEHESGSSQLNSERGRQSACYVCQYDMNYLYFHHIIEVQNGGSNATRNLIQICFECHKKLHPWLTVEPQQRRGIGFRQISDVMRTVFARIEAKSPKQLAIPEKKAK